MANLNIDDLMLDGWGVAKAADKGHPYIVKKQLLDAGKLLIKEMWKTRSITPENTRYVNRLQQTLTEFSSNDSNDMTQKISSAFWQSFEKRMGIK